MNEIDKFRSNAESRGLCQQYSELWDKCTSNRQLVDLAMDSNGITYLCDSIVGGWGLSVDYLACRFRMYINNKYTSVHDGYTSKLYVLYNENIVVGATNTVLVQCKCCVIVPKNTICNIYLANSEVGIIGEGTCYIRCYGRSAFHGAKHIKAIKL